MSASQVGSTWDAMALKTSEDQVIQCLKIIAPVERVTLVQNPMRREERIVMVRVAGESEPASLKSLGDGMTRVFQLALALEVARSRSERPLLGLEDDQAIDEPMLLIDEVETGIHYSALPDVWRFLLRAARESDVQVFATTHSWDCIEAFQKAAAEEPEGSAMLIRLERKGDEHRAVLFDQTELPVVTKHHIEVR
jgi:predicted ATPase